MSEPALEMDQELARRLLIDGATFIFLDVPPGTEFGIDMKSWNTGEKFRGVKMIPPGLHYVHYRWVTFFDETLDVVSLLKKGVACAVNNEGDAAPRVGFIHNFQKSEFLVKKWDPVTEDISTAEIEEKEKARLKSNLLNLDRYLGPYPFDVWKKWRALTSKITVELVSKLIPETGLIRSALELVSCDKSMGSPASKRRRSRTVEEKEEDLLPQLKPSPGTELRFTSFPERTYPEGASPKEITLHSIDSTYTLEAILKKFDSATDLIGELQFAFVCFLVGHSLEAFEHWKRLVGLLCSCEKAVPKYREMYSDFLTALEAHLIEIPEDFLVDIVASNNFVYCNLRKLFLTIQLHEAVDGRLKSKAAHFKERLTEHFQWDFAHLEREEDDEAPVVVNPDGSY